ncbi:hypothetical protein O1611_g6756 [Lasiodiplodia mahajangana]|uniref:Uncharacterized protein n=1 Tax=Lasiodiplodia mahajangana TaxID=1108764 RepID=A0ACC2JHE2_9PEZI|nr:hypothetical protein O1611_g6756 [Lasiodiplodia mahajangana]
MRPGAASLLLVAASGAQGRAVSRETGDYVWDVTQWQAGLSHGNPADPTTSCSVLVANFTVSGTGYESSALDYYIPEFGAHCTGSGAGSPLASDYSSCALGLEIGEAGGSVSARIVPDADFSQAHIAISYVFSSAGKIRNLTAIAVTDWARLRPPYNFTLVPSEIV